MSNAIEILVKQAIKTFTRTSNVNPCFEENYRSLKKIVDKMRAEDVFLDKSVTSNKSSKAPVTYIEIYEDKDITIGVFVLKPGCCLPLHDHPRMHGILKVLCGNLSIQSYSVIDKTAFPTMTSKILKTMKGDDKEHILAIKHQCMNVSVEDEACTLTESERNLHKITHTEGQYAAFLDVLAPPYNDDPMTPEEEKRDCHYFQEVEVVVHQGTTLSWLEEIRSPASFWSDSAPYFGPTIRHSDT